MTIDARMTQPQTTLPDGKQQSAMSDELLVARLRQGESAAGDALVRRYARPLLGYLGRLTGSPAVAEELHQQTWLSVLEHLDRFDPSSGDGSFKAWLFRIATNKANDLWRSRGRQHRTEDALRNVPESWMPDAASRMEAAETQHRVAQAIEKLPDPQREVVLMRYYSKMKFSQIAQALGIPLNTALGRMHKAVLKLREALGD